ncbi:MAG: tyrosine-type recombinase/integrase [Dehalococcoidales bacterium]|nr:tyrosine-type recombinase/integrase [Dehalococcoidales bacterium]
MSKQNKLLTVYELSLPDKSRAGQTARARAFLDWLGDREMSAENVRKWMDLLKHKGYADGSLAKDFRILRSLFIRNKMDWPFRRNDAPVIRERHVWAPTLAPTSIHTMVDVMRNARVATPYQKALLALSTVYGLRQGELQSITAESLDFTHKLIFIETEKHGRERYHMIPESILPYLKEWGFDRRFSSSMINLIFHQILEMAEVKVGGDVGWHAIRRACIMVARQAHIADNTIEAFYRWKRSGSNMTSRYSTAFQIVGGDEDSYAVMEGADEIVDQEIFKNHPFLRFWE